jgi:hypothetical protein
MRVRAACDEAGRMLDASDLAAKRLGRTPVRLAKFQFSGSQIALTT